MKLILHYESQEESQMLIRCFADYQKSENAKRNGVGSISVYTNPDMTCYFKRNKSGSYTGKICERKT